MPPATEPSTDVTIWRRSVTSQALTLRTPPPTATLRAPSQAPSRANTLRALSTPVTVTVKDEVDVKPVFKVPGPITPKKRPAPGLLTPPSSGRSSSRALSIRPSAPRSPTPSRSTPSAGRLQLVHRARSTSVVTVRNSGKADDPIDIDGPRASSIKPEPGFSREPSAMSTTSSAFIGQAPLPRVRQQRSRTSQTQSTRGKSPPAIVIVLPVPAGLFEALDRLKTVCEGSVGHTAHVDDDDEIQIVGTEIARRERHSPQPQTHIQSQGQHSSQRYRAIQDIVDAMFSERLHQATTDKLSHLGHEKEVAFIVPVLDLFKDWTKEALQQSLRDFPSTVPTPTPTPSSSKSSSPSSSQSMAARRSAWWHQTFLGRLIWSTGHAGTNQATATRIARALFGAADSAGELEALVKAGKGRGGGGGMTRGEVSDVVEEVRRVVRVCIEEAWKE